MYNELIEKVNLVKSLTEDLEKDVEIVVTGKKNIRSSVKKTCKALKIAAWDVRNELLDIERNEATGSKQAPSE